MRQKKKLAFIEIAARITSNLKLFAHTYTGCLKNKAIAICYYVLDFYTTNYYSWRRNLI